MKSTLRIIITVIGLSAIVYGQDMLNINDFNFNEENFNTSYITTDSTSLNISTIVSSANTVQNSNRFNFLLYGNFGKYGLAMGTKVNTAFYNIFQTTTAEVLLAKRVTVGEDNYLNFGLNAGMILNNLRENAINEYTDFNDPLILNGTYNRVGFTGGFGLNYNWKKRLDIGISLPVLVQSIQGVAPVFFTNVSYKQAIGDNFSVRPGVMVYGPNYITPTYEGNVELMFKDFVWVKAGGRSNKMVLFGAGGSVNFIKFGYMYNMTVGTGFNEVYTGLHNVNVSFHFLADKPTKKNKTVEKEVVVQN